MASSATGTDASAGYARFLSEMEKLNLGYVASHLPPNSTVSHSSYDDTTHKCTVVFHEKIEAGVSRDGKLMPGAKVVVDKEMEFQVQHETRTVFVTGLEAGVLGNTFGGKLKSVSSSPDGSITVNASVSMYITNLGVSQTFHPEQPKSILGWTIMPKTIQTHYDRAPAPYDGTKAPTSNKGWFGRLF